MLEPIAGPDEDGKGRACAASFDLLPPPMQSELAGKNRSMHNISSSVHGLLNSMDKIERATPGTSLNAEASEVPAAVRTYFASLVNTADEEADACLRASSSDCSLTVLR